MDDTDISELDVSNLKNLEQLGIERTKIARLDLTGMPKLQAVWGCTDNGRVVLTADGVWRDD